MEKNALKTSLHVHCELAKQEKIAAIDLGSFLGRLNSKYCMCLAFCTEVRSEAGAIERVSAEMKVDANALCPALFGLFLSIYHLRCPNYFLFNVWMRCFEHELPSLSCFDESRPRVPSDGCFDSRVF